MNEMKRRITVSLMIAAATVLLLLPRSTVTAQVQDKAAAALKAAMDKETLEGNLKSAIEQYKKIAEGKDRALAAQALIRMAGAYRKLGTNESQKIYERVVREFGDQKDFAAEAQRQLAALPAAPATKGGVVRRQVLVPDKPDYTVLDIAPNGRQVLYGGVLPLLSGKLPPLLLHDLSTGSDRPLLEAATAGRGMAGYGRFSKDGKHLSYSWVTGRNDFELRAVNLDGAGIPAFDRLLNNPEIEWIRPHDWTRDNKWIAVSLQRRDGTMQIGLVSSVDGNLRVLKSLDWREPGDIFIAPDDNHLAFDLPGEVAPAQRDIFILALDGSSAESVVGGSADDVVMGWTPDGQHLLIGSDRIYGSPNLWAIPFVRGSVEGTPKLVTDIGPAKPLGTMPSGVLYFGTPTFAHAYLRTASFDFKAEKFVASSFPQTINLGTPFPGSPAWSGDGKYLAYITSHPGLAGARNPVLTIRTLATDEVRDVQPYLGQLYALQDLSQDGRYFLVFGRDLKGRWGTHRIDATTGQTLTVVLHEQLSQAAFAPDGNSVYYRTTSESILPANPEGTAIKRRDLASGNETELFRGGTGMDLSPDGRFVAINRGGLVTVVPTDGGNAKDLTRGLFVSWAPDSQSLILRQLPLGPKSEIWRIGLDGLSHKVSVPPEEFNSTNPLFPFRINRDGHMAWVSVEGNSGKPGEIWAIEGLQLGRAGK